MAEETKFLTRKGAARYLTAMGYRIAPSTLARLAAARRGPPYARYAARCVSYEPADLDAWAARMRVRGGEEIEAAPLRAVMR